MCLQVALPHQRLSAMQPVHFALFSLKLNFGTNVITSLDKHDRPKIARLKHLSLGRIYISFSKKCPWHRIDTTGVEKGHRHKLSVSNGMLRMSNTSTVGIEHLSSPSSHDGFIVILSASLSFPLVSISIDLPPCTSLWTHSLDQVFSSPSPVLRCVVDIMVVNFLGKSSFWSNTCWPPSCSDHTYPSYHLSTKHLPLTHTHQTKLIDVISLLPSHKFSSSSLSYSTQPNYIINTHTFSFSSFHMLHNPFTQWKRNT